jgi:hypothetical protein
VAAWSNSGRGTVTMEFIANQLTALGQLDRPVFDQTGLCGSFNFALEFTPESNGNQPPAADLGAVPQAPVFTDALQEQIKLLSQKGSFRRAGAGPCRASLRKLTVSPQSAGGVESEFLNHPQAADARAAAARLGTNPARPR